MPLKNDWLHLGMIQIFAHLAFYYIEHELFASKALVAIYWMHFRVNLICIYFLAHKNTITERCSLRDDFNGNVVEFNVYKWRHSDVIVIKLIAATQN